MKGVAKIKDITVYDKDNRRLSLCTQERANKLVSRSCAMWLDTSNIRLLVNSDDRKKFRKEIIEEADRICYICNERIPDNMHPTLDHVIPKASYGRDAKYNLKCCCKRCNDDKANLLIEDYISNIFNNKLEYYWISEQRLSYLLMKYVND